MSDEEEWDGVYRFDPTPHTVGESLLKEGATQGLLVNWNGEPGAARAIRVVALADGDGEVIIAGDGSEWEDITVVDDRSDPDEDPQK